MKSKFIDVNGIIIKKDDTVLVPDPSPTWGDIHQHSFEGIVIGCLRDYVQVRDGDGDVWDIEPQRLTIVKS